MARAFFHMLRYFAGLDEAQTQTTVAERECIARYARGKHRVVEIGVFEGVTTAVIASALDAEAVLYGIDPFVVGRLGICWGKPIAKRQVSRQKPVCKVEFIEQYSPVACKQLEGTFDFIFIDGDHSWNGIVQDWADWSSRVSVGGIIALHDTSVPAHNQDVAQLGSHKYFVEHIQHDNRFRLMETVDSLNVLERHL